MSNREQWEQVLKSIGKSEWMLLADAVIDTDFQQILNSQQAGLLKTVSNNPNSIRGYEDYFADIISKYIAWSMYKKSGVDKLAEKVTSIEKMAEAEIAEVSKQSEEAKENIAEIQRVAKLVSGAAALTSYAAIFSQESARHESNASCLLKWYFFVVLLVFVVIYFVFFYNLAGEDYIQRIFASDVQKIGEFSLGVYLFKALLIFFGFQIVQFVRKNYNAEKHLAETYRHRSDVLNSLQAVYTSIDNKEEKDKLLSAAALFAYERGETGYITTKEGAGADGGLLDLLLGRVIK